MLKKDLAVCIRTVDYSETSQIVTFFAKDAGKISAIAKGSKRPKSSFDGPIELFAHGPVVYTETSKDKLATLTEFQQQISFSFPMHDLYALHCAALAAELLNNMTDEHDPHPDLFSAFMEFLKNLDKISGALESLITFQFILLKESGLMPVFSQCTNCKTKLDSKTVGQGWYFSSDSNGLICRDCEPSFPDKIFILKSALVRLYEQNSFTDIEMDTLKQLEKILISHFTHIMGKKLRMARYILSI